MFKRVLVANHYAALPPHALSPATGEDLASTTPALYASACQQCHGAEGVGTVDGPPLSGQPAPYLAQQLRDWQVSKRRNDGHHALLKVAQRLKPDEITQLSLYLARLPPRQAPAAR